MAQWFQKWFASEDYLLVYNHRDSNDAKLLTDLILKVYQPNQNSVILDSACGAGRHTEYFVTKGYKVIGFDLSMLLLLKAKENLFAYKHLITLIRADIREICFKNRFDLILNLFTSFGYFETDEENFSFIKKSINFMKPGGSYIFDYFNIFYLKENLVQKSYREINGVSITEERKIVDDRVIKEITLNKNGKVDRFTESVKLYDYKTLINIFMQSGYKLDGIYGSYDGDDFAEKDSSRLILFMKK